MKNFQKSPNLVTLADAHNTIHAWQIAWVTSFFPHRDPTVHPIPTLPCSTHSVTFGKLLRPKIMKYILISNFDSHSQRYLLTQCDQMVGLSFQYLAIENNTNYPNSIR